MHESLLKGGVMSVHAAPGVLGGVEKYRPPVLKQFTVDGSTAPISTILRAGPEGRNRQCECPPGTVHISYFEAISKEPHTLEDVCLTRDSFLEPRLPTWLTGIQNKTEFCNLPTVGHVFNVLSRGTHWWKRFNKNGYGERLSIPARQLLYSVTGMPLNTMGYLPTPDLLAMPVDRPAIGRLKNWFSTLDGLLISIYLASQGHTEICNWKFFDDVMQTYLKLAIGDLFKVSSEDTTYYELIKKYKGVLKDKLLKERVSLNGDEFPPGFWYYKKVVEVLNLDTTFQSPANVLSIAYLIQTRAVGLPPKPVAEKALDKFLKTVQELPKPISKNIAFEMSRAVDRLVREVSAVKNLDSLFNTAFRNSKISLSSSSSFFFPRELGGKTEAARMLLQEIPPGTPRFDLDTGQQIGTFGPEDTDLTPGEKMFHYSVWLAIQDVYGKKSSHEPHIGDLRISIVEEQGKARVITVSRIEHAIILHPLAHVLSSLLSVIPSSKAGLKAADHMWDTYSRITTKNIPDASIYSGESTFMCSEDWAEATDRGNPMACRILFDGLRKRFGSVLPDFYVGLCRDLFTMPRRLYHQDILVHRNFWSPVGLKTNGVLQGDPCCKQILHMMHIVSRYVGENRLRLLGTRSTQGTGKDDPGVVTADGFTYKPIPNVLLLKKRLPRDTYYLNLKLIFRDSTTMKPNQMLHHSIRTIGLKKELDETAIHPSFPLQQ